MERWEGKFAVVTGASAGIGAAMVKDLASIGLNVIALARRVEKIQENVKDFPGSYGKVFPRHCDVSNLNDIKATFEWIDSEFGAVHILVNNAAVIKSEIFLNL